MYLILVSTIHNVVLGDASNDVVGSFIAVATPNVIESRNVHKCGTKEALCYITKLQYGVNSNKHTIVL